MIFVLLLSFLVPVFGKNCGTYNLHEYCHYPNPHSGFSYDDAVALCQKNYNSYLSIIHTKAEMDYVAANIVPPNEDEVRIDGNDKAKEDAWVDQLGRSFTPEFDTGQPNGKLEQNCLIIHQRKAMHDKTCLPNVNWGASKGQPITWSFLCERDVCTTKPNNDPHGTWACATPLTLCTLTCAAGSINTDSKLKDGVTLCIEGAWRDVPYCKLKDCGNASIVPDGKWTCPSGTKFDSSCTFTCDGGYHPSQTATTAACQSDGKWQAVMNSQTCVLTKCGSITTQHGDWNCSAATVGATCNLKCDPGYQPTSGTTVATCLATGKWESIVNTQNCTLKHCGATPKIPFGKWNYSSDAVGSVSTLICDAGYAPLLTTTTASCATNGTWEHIVNIQQCQALDCGAAPNIVNGNWNCTSTLYNGRCHLDCDSKYHSINTATQFKCLQDGNWETAINDQVCRKSYEICYQGNITDTHVTEGFELIGDHPDKNRDMELVPLSQWDRIRPPLEDATCHTDIFVMKPRVPHLAVREQVASVSSGSLQSNYYDDGVISVVATFQFDWLGLTSRTHESHYQGNELNISTVTHLLDVGCATNTSENYYRYLVDNNWHMSDIPRTKGWHKYSFSWWNDTVTISIDNEPVYVTDLLTGHPLDVLTNQPLVLFGSILTDTKTSEAVWHDVRLCVEVASCSPHPECMGLDIGEHSRINTNKRTIGTEVEVSCKSGYTFQSPTGNNATNSTATPLIPSGHVITKCRYNKEWSVTQFPNCIPLLLPQPPNRLITANIVNPTEGPKSNAYGVSIGAGVVAGLTSGISGGLGATAVAFSVAICDPPESFVASLVRKIVTPFGTWFKVFSHKEGSTYAKDANGMLTTLLVVIITTALHGVVAVLVKVVLKKSTFVEGAAIVQFPGLLILGFEVVIPGLGLNAFRLLLSPCAITHHKGQPCAGVPAGVIVLCIVVVILLVGFIAATTVANWWLLNKKLYLIDPDHYFSPGAHVPEHLFHWKLEKVFPNRWYHGYDNCVQHMFHAQLSPISRKPKKLSWLLRPVLITLLLLQCIITAVFTCKMLHTIVACACVTLVVTAVHFIWAPNSTIYRDVALGWMQAAVFGQLMVLAGSEKVDIPSGITWFLAFIAMGSTLTYLFLSLTEVLRDVIVKTRVSKYLKQHPEAYSDSDSNSDSDSDSLATTSDNRYSAQFMYDDVTTETWDSSSET